MKFPRYVGYYVARECSETYLWLCKGTWTEGTCLYEHRQGKGLISSAPLVYDFRKTNRFTDERLIRLLAAMRTPGGQLLQNDAWEALKSNDQFVYADLLGQAKAAQCKRIQGWQSNCFGTLWRSICQVGIAQHLFFGP